MSNDNNKKSGYNNDAYITLIGNLATLKDPETGNQVHAYSKQMPNSNSKVANALMAVNHPNEDDADFWKLEVWSYDPNRSGYHNFLMDHCEKGRQVMVRGIPVLKRDKSDKSKLYPTIIVDKIVGLGGGNGNGNSNGGGNTGGQQQQQPQGQPNMQQGQQQYYQQQNGFPQQQQQGGFPPQPQQGYGQPQGGFPPQQQQGGFPPQQQQGYAQQGGFPPQPQGGFPQQGGFPPQGAPMGAPNGNGGPFQGR